MPKSMPLVEPVTRATLPCKLVFRIAQPPLIPGSPAALRYMATISEIGWQCVLWSFAGASQRAGAASPEANAEQGVERRDLNVYHGPSVSPSAERGA